MPVSKQNIIDRAMQLATNVAGDSHESVLVDAEATAEVIFPHALRYVVERIAKSGKGLEGLMSVHSIEISGDAPNGEGDLPDRVYDEYLDRSYLPEVQFGSKLPIPDYGRFRFDNQMCYYAIEDGKIYYSCDPRDINRKDESGRIPTENDADPPEPHSTLYIESESLTAADVGRRLRFVKADGTLVIDSFIDAVSSAGECRLRGGALTAPSSFIPAITIYEEPDEAETVTNQASGLTTEKGSDIIYSASLVPIFEEADVGRRITAGVYPTVATGRLTVVDAVNVFASGHLTVSVPSGYSEGTLTIRQGVAAVGTFFVSQTLPLAGDQITVGGVIFEFYDAPPEELVPALGYIPIRTTRTAQAAAIAQALTYYAATYPSTNVNLATYTSQATVAIVTYKTLGTAGNALTISALASGRVLASGATLSGGVSGIQSGEIIFVNGVQCIWRNGTANDTTFYIGEPEGTSAGENAIQLCNALEGAGIVPINKAHYSPNEDTGVVTVTHIEAGAVGNLFEIMDSDLGAITASGDNLTGGTGGIVEGETITLGNSGGVAYTLSRYLPSTPTNTILPFSSENDPVESANLIAEALNTKTDVKISVADYSTSLPPGTATNDDEVARAVHIVYNTDGSAGNNFSLGNSVPPTGYGITTPGISRSAATLLGGVSGNISGGETIVINGETFEFNNTPADDHIPFDAGGDREINATNIATHLDSVTGVFPAIAEASYLPDGPDVVITSLTTGEAGEDYTLAASSAGHVTPSASTLVLQPDVVAVDTFIEEFIDASSVRLRAEALVDEDQNDITISYVPLKFAAVSQPLLPTGDANTDLELPTNITDEIVTTIAAVLRGEIKLKDLTENKIA